jgi:hypothetical protein
MTDWRTPIYNFLNTKAGTGWPAINMMEQYTEPEKFVGFYALSDTTETLHLGQREYNVDDDIIDVSYSPVPLVTLQLDVRGAGAFSKASELFYGFKTWQDDLLSVGIHYRGVGNIVPIPQVQNGYVKSGYQFNLFFAYDTTIVNTVEYIEEVALNGN